MEKSQDRASKLEEIVKNPKVLVVDSINQAENSKDYKFVKKLKEIGYEFIFVKSAEEALNNVSSSINLVIQDLNTKDMPGIELLQKLKSKSPDSEIIIYSPSYHDRKELFSAGAYDMVEKPCVEDDEIIHTLEKALKHKEFTTQYIKETKKKLFPRDEKKIKKTIIYCSEEKETLSDIFEYLEQKGRDFTVVQKSYGSVIDYIKGIRPGSEEANSVMTVVATKKELIESINNIQNHRQSNLEIPVLALLLGDREGSISEAFNNGATDSIQLSPEKFDISLEYLFDAHAKKYEEGMKGKSISIKEAIRKIQKPTFLLIGKDRQTIDYIDSLLTSEGFNSKTITPQEWHSLKKSFKPNYLIFDPNDIYKFTDQLPGATLEGDVRTLYFSKMYAEAILENTKLILRAEEDAIPKFFHNLIDRGHVHFIPSSLRNHDFKSRIMAILDKDMSSEKIIEDKGNYILILTGPTCAGKDSTATMIQDLDKSFEIIHNHKDIPQYFHRLGESMRRQFFMFNEYPYKTYGTTYYINIEEIKEKLKNGKNIMLPCSADGAAQVEKFIRDSNLSTDIITICLRANEDTLIERLRKDKTRTPKEIEERQRDLETHKYYLNDLLFDAYLSTESVSPNGVALQVLEEIKKIKERGSLYYHKNFADNILKKVLPGGYDLEYLMQTLKSDTIQLPRDVMETTNTQSPSIPLYFSESIFRDYVTEKKLNLSTKSKIGRRKIVKTSNANGVVGIYLEDKGDSEETKKYLIDVFSRQLGQPTLKDETMKYNTISYYTNTRLVKKHDKSPVKTTNLISYSSIKEGMPKTTDYPHTVSFVILEKINPEDIIIETK